MAGGAAALTDCRPMADAQPNSPSARGAATAAMPASTPSAPLTLAPLMLSVPSDTVHISSTRHAIEDFAARAGFDATAVGDIGLLVNEAIANVIRHAYHGKPGQPIQIRAELDGATMRVTIRDWGNGVDPSTLPPRTYEPEAPGGLGLIWLR